MNVYETAVKQSAYISSVKVTAGLGGGLIRRFILLLNNVSILSRTSLPVLSRKNLKRTTSENLQLCVQSTQRNEGTSRQAYGVQDKPWFGWLIGS
jgi:hypothetical protein